MASVLFAEDDELQSRLVARYLRHEGHDVTVVHDGLAALEAVRREPPDLLVLDVMMPGLDGLAVCRTLRREGHDLPIVLVTAKVQEEEVLVGLELGADDYVRKPYGPRELVARCSALLRRAAPRDADAPLAHGSVTIDARSHVVTVRGAEVVLTQAELALLTALVEARGAVLSRGQLLTAMHGRDPWVIERAVDRHVKNLRAKIERQPAAPTLICTVFGVGYRLAADEP